MIKVFVDFDNTITVGDVGDLLFSRFGGLECVMYDEQSRNGLISAKDCIAKKSELCGAMDKALLDEFLNSQQVDSTFDGFINFCRAHDISLTVVSDGLDYYVDSVLRKHHWEHLPTFANSVRFETVDSAKQIRMVPSFPYDDEDCTRCACCKRNMMLAHSADEDLLVYIGDGYSDRCPVEYADIVFAKAELQTYCQKKNISYYEYRTFGEIQTRMQQIVGLKRFRRRREAEAKRRALYMAG